MNVMFVGAKPDGTLSNEEGPVMVRVGVPIYDNPTVAGEPPVVLVDSSNRFNGLIANVPGVVEVNEQLVDTVPVICTLVVAANRFVLINNEISRVDARFIVTSP